MSVTKKFKKQPWLLLRGTFAMAVMNAMGYPYALEWTKRLAALNYQNGRELHIGAASRFWRKLCFMKKRLRLYMFRRRFASIRYTINKAFLPGKWRDAVYQDVFRLKYSSTLIVGLYSFLTRRRIEPSACSCVSVI